MIDQLNACDTLTFYSPLTSKVLPDWVPTYWPLMKPFWMKREGSSRPSWNNTNDVSRAKEDGAKATYGVLRGDFGPVGHCSRSVWCKKAGRELRAETLELFGERGSSDEGRCGSVQSSCGSCEVAGSFEGKRSGRSYWHVFC